ncbi:MAG TPA: TIGR02594 family protein [Pseudolabrys sp.]|nr:TIGR02594 family protein [Pseudolabrys sp.]
MRLVKCGVTVLACSFAIAAGTGAASARPSHHHRTMHAAHHEAHHRHHRAMLRASARHERIVAVPSTDFGGPGSMPAYRPVDGNATFASVPRERHGRHGRRHAVAEQAPSFGGLGGGSSSLVAEARRYLGTNPTGRSSLWCGAFMDKVLRETGHQGGGNLAKGYLHYGHRVSGPQVGAIAVMGRRGGGHVGVVSGVDANGNPIIVSGNHNHTVAESVYPRSRIIAYVEPGS